jgi:hypothetical protein
MRRQGRIFVVILGAILMGAVAGASAEHLAARISEAVLITRGEWAVKRMFAHPELIRFETESTRIIELEDQRIVCGWLDLGPRGRNGTYRHPRRPFTYRETPEDDCATPISPVASEVSGFTVSESQRLRPPLPHPLTGGLPVCAGPSCKKTKRKAVPNAVAFTGFPRQLLLRSARF